MLVYSLLTPVISLQFLNHIILSFLRYAIEIYLSLHESIRGQFWNPKLIGINDNEEYSYELCKRYIN